MYDKWYLTNSEEIFKDFFTLLRFKSISSEEKNRAEIAGCAQWLKKYLENMGLDARIITAGHKFPLVFAESKKMTAPTLLFYGHYDVQDVEPVSLWKSDPFEPVVRNGEIYARGASDNKGQLFYTLQAIRFWQKKGCPLNIKVCLEGEEEAGSSSLLEQVGNLKDLLKCDYLLVPDFGIPAMDKPSVTLGVRGILPCEVEITGSNFDLHSGEHGGMALNPLRALVTLFSKFWDKNGKVAISGFYDDVLELSSKEKKEYDLDFDPEKYKADFGIRAFSNEKGRSLLEGCWLRPTIEINGIVGGHIKEGVKTVIPAKAIGKLSCRLVPNQNPEKIALLLEEFLKKEVQKGMEIAIKIKKGGWAYREAFDSPLAKVVSRAYSEVFSKPCSNILAGGSVPVVAKFREVLGCQLVLLGVSLPDDAIHAPNEHFGVERFKVGFMLISKIIELLGDRSL